MSSTRRSEQTCKTNFKMVSYYIAKYAYIWSKNFTGAVFTQKICALSKDIKDIEKRLDASFAAARAVGGRADDRKITLRDAAAELLLKMQFGKKTFQQNPIANMIPFYVRGFDDTDGEDEDEMDYIVSDREIAANALFAVVGWAVRASGDPRFAIFECEEDFFDPFSRSIYLQRTRKNLLGEFIHGYELRA